MILDSFPVRVAQSASSCVRATLCVMAVAGVVVPTVTSQELRLVVDSPLTQRVAPSAGAAWVDIDGDGDLDLFVADGNLVSHDNELYVNRDGGFVAVTDVPITSSGGASIGSCWGDMDGDGDLDAFVVNREGGDNFLYRNDPGGQLQALAAAPPANDGGNSNSASWIDIEGDGDLDLFVLNFNAANFLYLNDGSGGFDRDDVNAIAAEVGPSISAVWADIDGDRHLDVFFALGGPEDSQLFRNRGDGTFEQIAAGPWDGAGGSSIGASWGDIDNDGDLDLFVANFLDQDNFLYLNQGGGRFEAATAGDVVHDGGRSVGSVFVDLDLDGDLDLVVGNDGQPDVLYRNDGHGVFHRDDGSALSASSGNTFGIAAADLDMDGDAEIFVADRSSHNSLYENLTADRSWLAVELRATVSNPSAIGARVLATATIDGERVRQLREIVTQSGYNSQSELAASFGFGDAARVDRLEVRWPSGATDVLEGITVNQRIVVEEGSSPAALSGPEPKPSATR